MMSSQWNKTKTDNGKEDSDIGGGGEEPVLSIPDALREEFRNLCTARTRNIKFVLKALEKKTATTTKVKNVDEVEGKKKNMRRQSISEAESGEESSPAMSDGEEDSVAR